MKQMIKIIITVVCAVIISASALAHCTRAGFNINSSGYCSNGQNTDGAHSVRHILNPSTGDGHPGWRHPDESAPGTTGSSKKSSSGAVVAVVAVGAGIFVLSQVVPIFPFHARYDKYGEIYTGTEWDMLGGKMRFGVSENIRDNSDDFTVQVQARWG